MRNVSINGVCEAHDYERKVDLRNGSLVVHFSKTGVVIGTYLITSFRDNKNRHGGEQTASYCTFVNLDDGTIKFEERCSRNTTEQRLLSHLNPNDYHGAEAIKQGQYIKIFKTGDFKVNLSLLTESFKAETPGAATPRGSR